MTPPRLTGLTSLTLETAPSVCHECVWWQSRRLRGAPDKGRWMSRVEEEYGAFGTVYSGDDGKTLGVIQYGPAPLFPHAWELPGGPPGSSHACGKSGAGPYWIIPRVLPSSPW